MARHALAVLIAQGCAIAFVVWFLLTLALGSLAEIVDDLPPG